MTELHIVLSGVYYPMAILRYFEAALNRREDIELVTAGPYTGTAIPWGGGMHLPQKYAKQPTVPLPSQMHSRHYPISLVEAQLPWRADLWLQIDAGFHFAGRPNYGHNVIVGTDPHVLNYDRQRAIADTFYCMQACYAKPGDEYLPYAHDPIWHSPEEQERNFDVCLLGLHYPERNKLVDLLRRQGVKVYYDLGPAFDEARALYNQAPIGLNWSSRDDLTARVFELLGMRRLAIVNRVPDLNTFFVDGQDLVACDDLGEAAEKVRHYLDHPEEAQTIAKQGYEAVQAHTWDARIDQILNDFQEGGHGSP